MNAAEYLAIWRKHKVWNKYRTASHRQRFKKISSLLTGLTFLDVGCALGHSTHLLASLWEGEGRWAGMDFAGDAILEARWLFPQYDFYYSPDYAMTEAVSHRQFDTVVCSEVIEHVEPDRLFVEELMKLVGQRLVMTTPCQAVKATGHLRCYNRKTLNRLFRGIDYTVEEEDRFFYITIGGNNGSN
jgi:2-polyprenyl-3-methyl-5-hydroxy-6-metoxy-1,4-benzoquinol methylase